MFDSTLHAKTISRQIRKADFHSRLWRITVADKPQIVQRAVEIARDGFNGVTLKQGLLGGKPVYQHSSVSEALLTRHISESIRRITKVRQSDRQSIVRSLIALTAEGTSFKVFKLDIKSFYESINTDLIIESLKSDPAFSRQSIFVLEGFYAALRVQGINGLPRGINLSATLAEYTMRNFDTVIASFPGIRFYNRYVDDAIAIASEQVDLAELRSFVEAHLPHGLTLNRNKTKGYTFLPYSKSNTGACEHIIEFLGYKIAVGEATRMGKRFGRSVEVDISDKKVSKIKRRVARSLLAFNEGGSFDDLLTRIKLLTSNYGFIDKDSGQQRFSGLKYNYGLIDSVKSDALPMLDRFLTNTITSQHPQNRIRPNLNKDQRAQILGLRFKTGFSENRFFTFSYTELQNALRCWSHA